MCIVPIHEDFDKKLILFLGKCEKLGQQKYLKKNGSRIKNPIFKPKNTTSLRFGFGQCHTRNRGFDNLVKYALHKDFKKVECRYIPSPTYSLFTSDGSSNQNRFFGHLLDLKHKV